MKVEILGTRGNIDKTAPYHSKHSGVLVDDKILFDLGEKEYLKLEPSCVFITHLHPDHAVFVTEDVGDIEAPVYAPEASERMPWIRRVEGEVDFGHYRAEPVPTHHSKKVESMAYVLDDGSKRLLYTGDVIWINKEYHERLRGLDLVITDGSYIRKGGLIRRNRETGALYGHNGIPDLVDLFSRFTYRIVFTHFGSWFYKDIQRSRKRIEALGNEVKVEASYDGMTINL